MINQVIHGDCFEILRDIPDGSVDAVITDPPYGWILTQNLQKSKGGRHENTGTRV
ncbi:MAG: hypothetical protein ACKPEQ_37600 [Dolichospermum sp.]